MRTPLLLSVCLLAASGCDSGESSIDCSDSVFENAGTMTARIDGERFSVQCFDVETINGDLEISGVELRSGDFGSVEYGAEINLEVEDSQIGSSEVGESSLGSEANYTTASDSRFEAVSGTITLDEFSGTRTRGSFSFTTVNGIEVTDGEFDINL